MSWRVKLAVLAAASGVIVWRAIDWGVPNGDSRSTSGELPKVKTTVLNNVVEPPLKEPMVLKAPSVARGGDLRFPSGDELLRTLKREVETLEVFEDLKAKVLADESTTEKRKRIISDPRIGERLAPLLRTPAKEGSRFEQMQSAALELLLEARGETGSESAGQALRSVVSDDSIENSQLAPADREALAGVKAEILYKWTAQEPSIAGQVPAWLPGPASQAIWTNVQEFQAKNEAESLVELQNITGSP